jgi:hypothetical protein
MVAAGCRDRRKQNSAGRAFVPRENGDLFVRGGGIKAALKCPFGTALALKLRFATGDVQLTRRYLREVKLALAAQLAAVL